MNQRGYSHGARQSNNFSDFQIGVRGRPRVRDFRTEHALWVWRAKFFEVRVLRT